MLTVNASFRLLPTCDAVYMGDFMAVKQYRKELAQVAPQAELWVCDRLAAEQLHAKHVRMVTQAGLGLDGIASGLGNSGFHAINFAFLAGARHIILLGFDMKLGPNGERHWHGDHPSHMTQWMPFPDWMHKAKLLALDLGKQGARVVNCTPGSALHAFPHAILENELCRVHSS